MVGERSLIQDTVDRLAPLIPPERHLGPHQRSPARRDRAATAGSSRAGRFWPSPRSATPRRPSAWRRTFLQSLDPDAVMGVFPADHVVAKPTPLSRSGARRRFERRGGRHDAVLGIAPRWAETGYGYVEFPRGTQSGATATVRGPAVSRETGCREGADVIWPPGDFYWNAGMFFWRTERAAECAAPALAEDGDVAGLPAAVSLIAVLQPGLMRLPAMRKHLHRLRRA